MQTVNGFGLLFLRSFISDQLAFWVEFPFISILIKMLLVKWDFSPEPFRVLLSDIIFASVFTSHNASNSQASEDLKIVLTFVMISETQWTAMEAEHPMKLPENAY